MTPPLGRRARVLQFAATTDGGLATHVVTLGKGLDHTRFDVRVLCPPAGHLWRLLPRAVVAAAVLPYERGLDLLGGLRALPKLLTYLRRYRFDILHAHSTKASGWGRLAGRLSRVPFTLYAPNAYR